MLLIIGVLLAPSAAMGNFAEACCGVYPEDLQATAPDEACVGDDVEISITYTDVEVWEGWTEYDTGAGLKVWDPDGILIIDEDWEIASGQTVVPKGFSDARSFTADMEGTYAYEVVAWAESDYGGGKMYGSAVGGEITVEECVGIDIKPGSDPNSINLKSKGVIPVAILGNAEFDVNTVDLETVAFGEADPACKAAHYEDVNIDSFFDVVLHFRTQEVGLESGDTEACLTFEAGGEPYTLCDSVNIVPKDK